MNLSISLFSRCRFFLICCLLMLCVARVQCAPKQPAASAMSQYLEFALHSCDRVEARLPELTAIAETIAERHANGGKLGVIWEPPRGVGPQGTQYELKGRSGGMMAFDSNLKKELPNADRTKDIALVGWQRAPDPTELETLKRYHEKYYVIGFGPRALPELAAFVKLCDVWIDTGMGADDRAITLPNGARVGRGNHLINMLDSWALVAEVVAALTRQGKMPTMLKSHSWPDAKEWNARYRGKAAFHDDMQIAPIAPGVLAKRYLDRIRVLIRQFGQSQQAQVQKAAQLITDEVALNRRAYVMVEGHSLPEYVGQYEDELWAKARSLENTKGQIAKHLEQTDDGALVLQVGYMGLDQEIAATLRQKKQRVFLITSKDDQREETRLPEELLGVIDMGWRFGDAAVEIEGYPARVFPPSGIMQLVAYEAVNVEVLSRFKAEALEKKSTWQPLLPGSVNGVATVTTKKFLAVPAAVEALHGQEGAAPFVVARTAPIVELAYHSELPDAALNGTGWSAWGDICVASDGRVYFGTGNHGKNDKLPSEEGGQAFIYSWDPQSKAMTKIVDVNAFLGVQEGDPTWSKVHAGIIEGKDRKIYFTCTLNDGGRSWKTPWTKRVPGGQLFQYDPQSGQTKIVLDFPGEVTPTTLYDRQRDLWYANMEGKGAPQDVALTAVELTTGKLVYQSAHDSVVASRNLALARSGAVIFNGKDGLWKFDPETKSIAPTKSAFPDGATMRASSGAATDGSIYGATTRPGQLFRYRPEMDQLEMLGPDFLKGDYTTVMVLSPDEKYLYYLPGAHGGATQLGTPVMQYEIKSGTRKVLAFLNEGIAEATGYSPAGTYGVKISADGSTLFVNFNGNFSSDTRRLKGHSKEFGLTAFCAIHIPASERY